MLLLKGIFLLISVVQLLYGFPDGAGTQACTSMAPMHGGNQPQTTPAPYSITPSLSTVHPGQSVSVTISRTNAATFLRGFMIQARNAANVPVGQFFLTTGMRLMNCPNFAAASVATHSNNDQTVSITLVWTPPTGFVGNVVFHVTAVHNFATFWLGLVSQPVTVTL